MIEGYRDEYCLNDDEESVIQDIIAETENPKGFEIVSSEQQSKQEDEMHSGSFVRCSYGSLEDENNLIDDQKCISSVSQLKALVGKKCRMENCDGDITDISHKVCGFCVKLEWVCHKNHRSIWYSSPFYAAGLALNYIVEGALLLSGGQINQFRRFCQFANIGKCSTASFYQNQRLYVSTAVDQEFEELREQIINEIKAEGNSIILCGDGRMDSPGFSATKGSYTMMDYKSKKLVSMEIGDKERFVELLCGLLYIFKISKGVQSVSHTVLI